MCKVINYSKDDIVVFSIIRVIMEKRTYFLKYASLETAVITIEKKAFKFKFYDSFFLRKKKN
jgi:hypothetical protein